MRRAMTYGLAGAAGAALAYLLDPTMGRSRRVKAADQIRAGMRRTGRKAGRKGRYAGGQARGMAQRLIHRRPEQREPDDVTLAQRVRSELFADASVPKGAINIDAHDGVVVLRGEVPDPSLVARIADTASSVADVRRVENLLHLPGERPPNLEALRGVGG